MHDGNITIDLFGGAIDRLITSTDEELSRPRPLWVRGSILSHRSGAQHAHKGKSYCKRSE
jgi:hypothetical protein